jgi:hypothetical protein
MSGRSLKTAALNTDPVPELNGTVWGASNVSLKVKPGSVVDLIFGPPSNMPTYINLPYLRTGRAIHFTATPGYKWFTVITNASTMQGTNHAPGDPTVYAFKVTKQRLQSASVCLALLSLISFTAALTLMSEINIILFIVSETLDLAHESVE